MISPDGEQHNCICGEYKDVSVLIKGGGGGGGEMNLSFACTIDSVVHQHCKT